MLSNNVDEFPTVTFQRRELKQQPGNLSSFAGYNKSGFFFSFFIFSKTLVEVKTPPINWKSRLVPSRTNLRDSLCAQLDPDPDPDQSSLDKNKSGYESAEKPVSIRSGFSLDQLFGSDRFRKEVSDIDILFSVFLVIVFKTQLTEVILYRNPSGIWFFYKMLFHNKRASSENVASVSSRVYFGSPAKERIPANIKFET